MTFDAKAGFSGLVTATAETTGAPSGLRIADNVTLRKEGALTPRPVSTSTALARAYRAAFPYRGALYYVGASNVLYDASQAQVFGATTPAVRDDVQSAKEARGNLYYASSAGVFKITGLGALLALTGLTPGEATLYSTTIVTTGTPLILAPNQYVAYRLVARRTDVNGVILRSRPTGAFLVSSAALNATPSVTISLRNGAVVDDVEVYRTRVFPTSTQYDDEMQLVATIPSSLFVGSSPRLYTFEDRVPDAARGTTLYTSPSRGGIENANDRPPGAACLERFRGSMFYGNVVGPQRVTFSYKYPANPDRTGQATGLGNRSATGNTTIGSFNITAVSVTTGVQVGMAVQMTAAGISSRITAIAGSTVTVANAATANTTGAAVTFTDLITWNTGGVGPWATRPTFVPAYGPAYGMSFTGLSTAYEITPPIAGYDVTVVFETIYRGNQASTISATHGDEYNPPLPLTSGTPLTMPFDVFPHGLAWSEPDEPEHVPPKNFARVGDAGRAILALVATKDRLLIFKEDGLFMLTGDTARNFAIYPLDTTCLCILPGSVRRLKNTVFLLSNLGLVAVDDSGSVSIVSRPIQLEVASIVNAIRAAQKSSGLYNMPGLTGVTGAGDDAQGEYHLALGSSTPSFGGQVLVYSIPRDGFTTFSFGTPAPVALATDGEGNPLVLTASTLLTPTTTLGAVLARVSPRAFADPALVGKFWTHITAGFSQLTGTTSVQARFTSSEAQVDTSLTETIESGPGTTVFHLPLGSLLRHPVPSRVRRAYLLFVELLIDVATGTFTLETIAAEARGENIPNKRPSHGSGAT